MTDRYVDVAVSEVHAARTAMRNAFLALDKALLSGEQVGATHRRLIDTEISGTGEEAAVIAALLSTARRD